MSWFPGLSSREILNSLRRENLDFGSGVKPAVKAVVISGQHKAGTSEEKNFSWYSLR